MIRTRLGSSHKQMQYAYITGAAKFFQKHKEEAADIVPIWEEDISEGDMVATKLLCILYSNLHYNIVSGARTEALLHMGRERRPAESRVQKLCEYWPQAASSYVP